MSVSLHPVDDPSAHLLQHDQRDAPSHSPALTASPLPPSPPSSSSGPSTATDSHSPFSLPAVAPAASPASSDSEEQANRTSAAARIRSLITGVSTSLIASAVREKAYGDLLRLEEIFASPAEQAHLTKQQKWKLALRQQRLKLYLQQPQLELQLEQQQQQNGHEGDEPEAAGVPDAENGQRTAVAGGTASGLTIFTTPPLPPSNLAPNLARELSSFSLYTPDSLNAHSFTFAAPPLGLRTPSAPAEAQYAVVDDERLQTSSDDSSVLDDLQPPPHSAVNPSQPSTPTSSSSSSAAPSRRLPLPPSHRRTTSRNQRLAATTSTGTPSPALLPALPVQVSRSGRTIKRRFDVSVMGGGRKSRRVVEGGPVQASGAAHTAGAEEEKVRAWERGFDDEDESEDEESEG